VEPRLDGALGHAQSGRDLGDRQLIVVMEDEDRPLLDWEAIESPIEGNGRDRPALDAGLIISALHGILVQGFLGRAAPERSPEELDHLKATLVDTLRR